MSQQAQETVVVPREPTLEMIEAYFDTVQRLGFHACINASTAWSAMTRAAPVSPDSDLLKEAVGLLREYRDKTPLGHQPHMIAGRADAFLSKVEERGHD